MMNPAAAPLSPRRIPALLSAAVLALAALAAWYNSLSTPFFFDDEAIVLENPTIRRLWPIWAVLSPPASDGGSGATARPAVNLTLAINYALDGVNVRGYHLLNVVIHVLAALALLGVVRRTLALAPPGPGTPRPMMPGLGRSRFAFTADDLLALAVALLWMLHPLQTEAVTCVVHRTESLVGLCYLTTLYCFSRAALSLRSVLWPVLTVAACLAGMASKEVMVSAPLIMLLYDRAFVAGTFREAWRQRRALYLGLAATWILLGYLVISSGGQRAGSVGFGLGASWWSYALTQCRAIVLYLKLSVWPHPLVIDYGMDLVPSVAAVWWQAAVLVALVGATIWALARNAAVGFLGAWFFLILAPSSSVLPLVTQTMAEHRMYLSLAAPVVLGVLALHRWTGRRALVACFSAAVALGWLTVSRNHDYRSPVAMWEDAIAKRPANPRAHGNLGNALLAGGRYAEAVERYREALRLRSDYHQMYNNLGNALVQLHRPIEAIDALRGALLLFPLDPDVHYNLGNAFLQLGRTEEAIREYDIALRVGPPSPGTEINLAMTLLGAGRTDEAIPHFQAALRLQPERAATHFELGGALLSQGGAAAAEREFREAVRLAPGYAEAHFALGNLLAQTSRYPAAIAEYQQALKLQPDHLKARNNLGNVYLVTGRLDDAIAIYEDILRQDPGNTSVRENLEAARVLQRRRP